MQIDPLNITSLASTAEIDECLATRTAGCVPRMGDAYGQGSSEQVSAEVERQIAKPGGAGLLVDRVYFTGVCKLTSENACEVNSYFNPPAVRAPFVDRWAALPNAQRDKLLAEAAKQDQLLASGPKHPAVPSIVEDMLSRFVAHDMRNLELYVKTHPT